jgi:drug/metabolite transporter (DMT)-like permease
MFFFISGAVYTVAIDIMYHTPVIGLHNYLMNFRKPLFQVWGMFLGMSCLFFVSQYIHTCNCRPYVVGETIRGWGLFRMTSVPAMCDLTAAFLCNTALLHLNPSIWQMLRGVILLFTALLGMVYRHKRLQAFEWIGIIVTLVGGFIVGLSAVLDDIWAGVEIRGSSPLMQAIAIGLVLIADAVQALQCLVEEEMMHDCEATGAEVVGFEGFWGLSLSTFVIMPLSNIIPSNAGEGIYENSIESFVMLARSPQVVIVFAIYVLAVAVYNQAGMIVTAWSGAVYRTLFEALRSAAVWVLSVCVHYIWPESGAGEPIGFICLLEGGGFVTMLTGTLIYNQMIELPCCEYESEFQSVDVSAAQMESMTY